MEANSGEFGIDLRISLMFSSGLFFVLGLVAGAYSMHLGEEYAFAAILFVLSTFLYATTTPGKPGAMCGANIKLISTSSPPSRAGVGVGGATWRGRGLWG